MVIESRVFLGCGRMRVVGFPQSLSQIGESAFEETGLEAVNSGHNSLVPGDRCFFSGAQEWQQSAWADTVMGDLVCSGLCPLVWYCSE